MVRFLVDVGNLKISELFSFLNKVWPIVLAETAQNKLVNVYLDRIESVE